MLCRLTENPGWCWTVVPASKMEDSTSSINLLSMKTYPSENNNLLETNIYKLDFDESEKMKDTENPTIIKKKRRLRFVLGWSVVVFSVLLLIALIVLFIKFSGDDGDKGGIVSNATSTTISPTPSYTVSPSSTVHPSTTVQSSTVSMSTSSTLEASSITTHSTYTLEPVKPTSVISSVATTTITTSTVVTTAKPPPACLVDEFQCSDGTCIQNQNVCNGKPDCSSGEDEQRGCECSDVQFRCHSGQCIEEKFRCDQVLHCADHSDEMNCTGCTGFQCASGECLWIKSVQCDEHVNCLDLSDEMNCNVGRKGYSKCKNGLWIKDDKFCDSVDDCFDNSDETNCGHECNFLAEMPCGDNHTCIVHQWKCDGHDDCPNGWDESNSTCGECEADEFKCSDHVCIPNHEICDGVKQCLSGTDETDCIQLYESEDSTSSVSGVVKLKSSGQLLPICSDVWSVNITSEICEYFGHSDVGAMSSFVTLTSVGLSAPSSYMLVEDIGRKLADHETVLSRFTSSSSCSSEKIVSVTCQPSTCGQRKVRPEVPFIVGGTLAPKGQWPWVVSISLLGKGVCGGAVVGPRWILTAAHCIITSGYNYTLTPHFFEITAGTITRTRSENDTAQRQRVDKIILYPNTTRLANGIYDWDLALMHLDGPLQYGDYLQPICLPSQGETYPTNSQCYLAGWGFINEREVTVNLLREAKMRLYSDEDCAANSYNQEIPINVNSVICAGYHSGIISGCKGDSGSPLMCKDNRDQWNVVGIMSYGTSGCDGQSSGRVNRMAKVSSVSDWITSVIEKRPSIS